jgi:hypothetical protein
MQTKDSRWTSEVGKLMPYYAYALLIGIQIYMFYCSTISTAQLFFFFLSLGSGS